MQLITLESLGGGALDAAARAELRSALKGARRTAEVLVITGASGSWNHARATGDAQHAQREFHSLALAVIGHPAPVIAALSGPVTDFGLALAAAADVRIAAEGTTFRVTEPGAALETGAYRLLSPLLGRARTDDLVYTGREWSAADAVAAAFVSGPSRSPADAEDLAVALAAPGAAALKRAATAGVVSQLTEQLGYDAWLALSAAGETP